MMGRVSPAGALEEVFGDLGGISAIISSVCFITENFAQTMILPFLFKNSELRCKNL